MLPVIKSLSTEALIDELLERFEHCSIELCKADGKYRDIVYSAHKGEWDNETQEELVELDEDEEGA